MLWIVILGILLILIIAIIITMFKIIKGSNDIQESKERSSSRARGSGSKGSGSRNNRSSTNNRNDHKEASYNSRKKPRKEEENYDRRPSKRAHENMIRGSSGPKRRWKVILVDVATHEEYEFIFSDTIGVGRAFIKDGYEDYLVINDPKVSKRHCSIFTGGDNLYIQDEGSSNYTFVNNNRVSRPTMIQKEDIIGIGNTELEVFKVFRESR